MNYKIYQIKNNKSDEIYIGSTCKKNLKMRLNEHKADYIKWKLGNKNYISVFKIFDDNDYEMILLEEGICENKNQKLQKKKNFINTINCINIVKNPILTNEERIEYQSKYLENTKEYRQNYHKNYYEENKDKLKENSNNNYHKNKGKLLEKVICECGCEVIKMGMRRHLKTKKHIDLMNQKN